MLDLKEGMNIGHVVKDVDAAEKFRVWGVHRDLGRGSGTLNIS